VKILIIEDIPEWQEQIGAALKARGHVVMRATTLPEAHMAAGSIRSMVSGGFPPDGIAVFADHDLPWDEGGYDDHSSAGVVRDLRALFPSIPIVAISAVESNNEHLIAVGANLACIKGELLQCLDEVLARCEEIRTAGAE
jgi:CheY-like chemotaxis protein